jgi:uncharacterized cupredoxin-like copper-binding protein
MVLLRRGALLAVLAAAALVLAGCSGDGGVGTTLKDFSIDLDDTSADAGDITFDIHNDGPSAHEFVVFKTDLAEDDLPTTEDANGAVIVDEEGEGLEPIDEVEDIAPDDDAELSVELDAGSYVLICNLPSHYKSGMHTTFTVD